MLHAKFQDHRTSGSGEDFKGFYYIWAWWSSWSCDLVYLHKLSFSLSKVVPHEFWLDLPSGFRRVFEHCGRTTTATPSIL